MQRAHRLGVAALVLALVTLVGVAYAQTSTAVTGTVLSVDPQARSVSIKTDAGATQTFLLADPIGMRSAGKDISVSELKVGDRVRIEPTPGAGTEASTLTASRLEVLGAGQRTVSTERPVLGEPADVAEDRNAMPSSAGSTTGRTVSTDRPVFGQKPGQDTATPGAASTSASTTTGTTPGTAGTYGSSTSGAATTPPSPSPSNATTGTRYGTSGTSASNTSNTSSSARAHELPATASPLPMIGVLGLFALAAGLAVRATRKQHS